MAAHERYAELRRPRVLGVELHTVWTTIQDELPSLVPLLSRLLAEQRDSP